MPMRDPAATIGNMIDKQKLAYISVVDEDGFPCTNAMLAPRKREGIRVLWFSTNTSSLHVERYRKNPKASVYVCDSRFFRGVLLKGTMEIREDAESKKMLWQTGDTMYYPKGVADPDYCVMKFTAISGRYYANFKKEDFTVE